jgi:hypothetical protein
VGRLRPADVLAGIGGAVLLGSLFLDWYGFSLPGVTDGPTTAAIQPFIVPGLTAWKAFTVTDILLAAVAVLAISLPLVTAVARGPAKPVAVGVTTTVAGAFAVLLVLYRIVNQPGDNRLVTVESGAWGGLAGAVLLTVGAWLALADECTPGAVLPQVPRRPVPEGDSNPIAGGGAS